MPMRTPSGVTANLGKIGMRAALALAVLICIAGLLRVNVGFAGQYPGGSDFLVAWEGMRSVMRGESPYSDRTAAIIQERPLPGS